MENIKLYNLSYNVLKSLTDEQLIKLYNTIADTNTYDQSSINKQKERGLQLYNEILRRLTSNWVIGSSFNPNNIYPTINTRSSIDRKHIDWGENAISSSSIPRYNFVTKELNSSNIPLDANTIRLVGEILINALISKSKVSVGYEFVQERYYSPVVIYDNFNENWIILDNIIDDNKVKIYDIPVIGKDITEITEETIDDITSNWSIFGIYNNTNTQLLITGSCIGSTTFDTQEYVVSLLGNKKYSLVYDEINYDNSTLDMESKSLVGWILLDSYIKKSKVSIGYENRIINKLQGGVLNYYVPVLLYNPFGENWIQLQNIENEYNVVTKESIVTTNTNSYITELYEILSYLKSYLN